MTDILSLYNPANAAALTEEQIAAMQLLTTAEIRQLAIAYPNKAFHNAYLLIVDRNVDIKKQPPSATSFENLYNLRAKHGLENWVAYNFRTNFKRNVLQPVAKQEVGRVLDLSDTELMSLPGFKTAPTIEGQPDIVDAGKEIQVKKINKKKQ